MYSRVKLFLIIFFSTVFIKTSYGQSLSLVYGDQLLIFKSLQGFLISKCPKEQCLAKKAIDKIIGLKRNKKLKPYIKQNLLGPIGPSSLGDIICHKALLGKTFFAKKINGDLRSVCLLNDESLIEVNSISDFSQ